jgi:hypothetical protein
MKTPDEVKKIKKIKKGLKVCRKQYDGMHWISCHLDCPYKAEGVWCEGVLHADALAYIIHLESRLAQVERERDAAVADIDDDGDCYYCKRRDLAAQCDFGSCSDCGNEECPCFRCDRIKNNFEWRGVCPENSKEE